MALDGRPLAFAGPHGQSYDPFEARPPERESART